MNKFNKRYGNQKIKVIGVYEIEEDKDAYLIELTVEAKANEIEINKFIQEYKGKPQHLYQIADNGYYLDLEGNNLISKKEASCYPTRLIIFMFYLNFKNPLTSQFGSFRIPKPSKVPNRLKNIIDYDSLK